VTPGSARTPVSTREWKSARAAGVIDSGRTVFIVSTPSARNPLSTAWTRHIAFSSRPAATSSTTVPTTSPSTSATRSRPTRPPASERERSVSRPLRDDRSAGPAPNATMVTRVRTAANTNTRQSISGAPPMGSVRGTSDANDGAATTASSNPAAPPAAASIALSVKSCRTRRSRPAPRDRRTAISWRRAVARANSRLARLVQPMSVRQNAAPSTARINVLVCGEMRSRRSMTAMPTPAFSFGYARSSRVATTAISLRASSAETPGRRRPITASM
jgi:hypothetical protein